LLKVTAVVCEALVLCVQQYMAWQDCRSTRGVGVTEKAVS
jgi:hypothetical protein